MKRILLMYVALIMALVFMVGGAADSQYDCSDDLEPCRLYVNSDNIPGDSCCNSMKEATVNRFICLCNLVINSSDQTINWMNFTQARSLRSRCLLEDLSPSNSKDMDTLKQGETFSSPNFLSSTTRVFALGFVISPWNMAGSFLAIWYANNPAKLVWIANRDRPVEAYSGVLPINGTGNFAIKSTVHRTAGDIGNQSIEPVTINGLDWIMLEWTRTYLPPVEIYPGTTAANSNVSATLFDNGNLVSKVVNSDGSTGKTLGRSFDYPMDTLG